MKEKTADRTKLVSICTQNWRRCSPALASVKSAPVRSARAKLALWSCAPLRFAPFKLVNPGYSEVLAFVIPGFCGLAPPVLALSPEEAGDLLPIESNRAPRRFAPLKSAPSRFAPRKFAPDRFWLRKLALRWSCPA